MSESSGNLCNIAQQGGVRFDVFTLMALLVHRELPYFDQISGRSLSNF